MHAFTYHRALTPPARGFEPGIDALPEYVALEFGQGSEDMEVSLPLGVVVSIFSVSECNSTPRSWSKAVVSIS